ncbi:MAG: dihydroorotase [Desulfotomaculaceae bacterium]
MGKLLIKGGNVVNALRKTTGRSDILIVDGKIAEISPDISLDRTEAEIIDASGMYVLPGLIDMHVHLRDPGYEFKETIASGGKAAVKGGFTAVACMPNTNPVADNKAVVNYILERARVSSPAKIYPIAAITKGSRGQEIVEMADLRSAGAVAFSDDGNPVCDSGVMRRAMEYAAMLSMPVISHSEDLSLSKGGVMHEGYNSTVLGLKGIPAPAEEVMIARELILAGYTGCRVHIAHVSTAGSVNLIREAKARRVPVTAEATPHHFSLTDEAVTNYNTLAKVNPPLRTAYDVEEIKKGLADGTIDVIATDHAPHTFEEKDVEFDHAPFGIVGLETAFGLVYKELVLTGVLSIAEAVAKMTVNPAGILKLDAGRIEAGCPADITIVDPNLRETVEADSFASKGRNTPFSGWKLQALPVATIVDGKVAMMRSCFSRKGRGV